MADKPKSTLQKIEESRAWRALQKGDELLTKGVDKTLEVTDKLLGASGKAWLANGLDELRQAVALGNGQVQAGNNPGLWGTITTGEATAERLGTDKDKQAALYGTYDVPAVV